MADEAYSVQSTLSVKDELSAALARAATEAKKLDQILSGLKQGSPFARVTETIDRISSASRRAAAAGRDMGTVFDRAGSLAARGLSSAADQAERLQRALEGSARVKAPAYLQPSAGGGISSSAARGPVWSGGGAAGAAYRQRIGTQPSAAGFRAAMTSGQFGRGPFATAAAAGYGPVGIPSVPPGARATYGVHTGGMPPVPPVGGGAAGNSGGGGFGRYLDGAVMMQGGAWAREAGQTIGDGIFQAIRSGADVIRQQNLLWASGMSASDQANAMRAAQQGSYSLPMFNVAENLKSLGELRSVGGSMSEAIRMLSGVNQYQMISSAVGARGASAYTAARTGEMLGWLRMDRKTGQFDEGRFHQFMQFMSAAQISTHGRVDDRQMFNFAQMGSLAAKNMSIPGLQNMVPIINEMGGSRAGTALQSINQQFQGGVMPDRVFDELNKLGLVSRVAHTAKGKPTAYGSTFRGMAQLGDNPVAWVEDVMVPAMEKAGIGQKGQVAEIMKLFGRSTSQREAGVIATQMLQIAKDVAMQQQVMSPNSIVGRFMSSDVYTAAGNTMGALNHALENIGMVVGPQAVTVLGKLTSGFNDIAKFAQAHPQAVKRMVDVAAGVAVAAAAIGSIMTVVGGFALFGAVLATPAGLAAAGTVVGIAEAIATLGTVGAAIYKTPWSKLFNGFEGALASGYKIAAGRIAAIGPAIWAQLVSTFDWLKKKIESLPGLLLPGGPTAVSGGDPGRGLSVRRGSGGSEGSNDVGPTGQKFVPGKGFLEPQHTAFISALKSALNGVTVQMDGEKVATLVTHHQVNAMKRPLRGKSSFDNTQNPRRVFHATNQWA